MDDPRDERNGIRKSGLCKGRRKAPSFNIALFTSCIPMHLCFHKYLQTFQLHIQLGMMKILELGGSLPVRYGWFPQWTKRLQSRCQVYYAASDKLELIVFIWISITPSAAYEKKYSFSDLWMRWHWRIKDTATKSFITTFNRYKS